METDGSDETLGHDKKQVATPAGGEQPGKSASSCAAGEAGLPPAAGAGAAPAASNPSPHATLLHEIDTLRAQQKAQRAERHRLAMALRNAKRKRSRIREKAKQLSNEDLALVMAMRAETAAAKVKKAEEEQTVSLSPGADAACSEAPA